MCAHEALVGEWESSSTLFNSRKRVHVNALHSNALHVYFEAHLQLPTKSKSYVTYVYHTVLEASAHVMSFFYKVVRYNIRERSLQTLR